MRSAILRLVFVSLCVSSCLAQGPCSHRRVFQDDGDSCLDSAPSPSVAVIRSILATKEAEETLSDMEPAEQKNLPRLLRGLTVHLTGGQQEDMVVRGDFPLSGGDNTWFWIVTSINSHPVAFWVQGNSVTILSTQHSGYSDIRTDWAAGSHSATRVFRHDGRGYKLFREDYPDLPPSPDLPRPAVRALQTFDIGEIPCELREVSRERPEPENKIVIACNHSNLLTYDLGRADVTKIEFADSSAMGSVRSLVTFERGLTVTLAVFNVSGSRDKATAKIAYEHSSQNAAEAFEDGDVILEHVQRRFEAGSTILPGGTNLYRWQDGRYTFVEGFQWNPDASWAARYCILYKPESCPAERMKTRIPDEFEH